MKPAVADFKVSVISSEFYLHVIIEENSSHSVNVSNFQTLSKERKTFETKWNYFNNIRTVVGFLLF